MLLRNTKVAAAAAVVLGLGALASAGSTPFVLDFEGLGVHFATGLNGFPSYFESVGNFYSGDLGGSGHGPGPNYGVQFSSDALAIMDDDAHGLDPVDGGFGGEPTPNTALAFNAYDPNGIATITYAAGFTDGFSLYYSSIESGGYLVIYDGIRGAGNELALLVLPMTEPNGAPDPTGVYSPFVPIGVSFEGTAKSISFVGETYYDNITFGSATPLSGNTVPIPLPLFPDPPPPTNGVLMPLPAALPAGLALLAALGLLGVSRRRHLSHAEGKGDIIQA